MSNLSSHNIEHMAVLHQIRTLTLPEYPVSELVVKFV